MRDEIRQKIEIIQRGEVPEGYKKTKVGIFPLEWRVVKLDVLVDFQNGINAEKGKFGKGTKIIGVSDVLKEQPIIYENIIGMIDIGADKLERYSVSYGDILFQRSSENVEDAGKSNVYLDKKEIATFGGFVIRGKKKVDYNPILINEILKRYYVRKQIMRCAAGAQHINIGQESLKKVSIGIPMLNEQTKIADIIELYGEQEVIYKKMIIEAEQQKKWLMQNLLTGKKRLKNYDKEWKEIRLSKFIEEINEKTTKNNEHEILSVTKKGIVKQSEHFNKQIASEDNTGYKIVRLGNLVFSTMNLWMGSLDVLKRLDIGIVSPAYKVFQFDSNYMIPDFGEHYMKSSYMIWMYNINSEQGASIVRKNLDLTALLNTKVCIPDISEQQAIAKILSLADKEIELLQQKLEQMKLEKKAMMQLLLSGIVRVN